MAAVLSVAPNQTSKRTFRTVLLKLHLVFGLAAAVFLVILGITGAVIGFEQEIPRWLHRSLWYVKPGLETLPESQVLERVEKRFAPARVRAVTIQRDPRLSQVIQVTVPANPSVPNSRTARRVFVNPYDGSVLGFVDGQTRSEAALQAIHSFHQRIGMGDTGKLIVTFAGLILCFEVVFGLILWWRRKRTSIDLQGSWFRVFFDLHNVIGIYAAFFLWMAGSTGVVIGFEFMEPLIFKVTHSSRPMGPRELKSDFVAGAQPISVDQAMSIARQTLPDATIAGIQLPASPRGAFNILMRVPEDTSPAVHSFVTVDQYTGRVLYVQDFKTFPGYRLIRFNRSLHTGDVLGWPTHALMSLTSLLLVVMVVTGAVIWWKKLVQ